MFAALPHAIEFIRINNKKIFALVLSIRQWREVGWTLVLQFVLTVLT